MAAVTVNGENLTIEDVCDVAYRNEGVQLPEDKQFWETMENHENFWKIILRQEFRLTV